MPYHLESTCIAHPSLQEIFLVHLKRMVENTFGLILSSYGNPWKICPSPLLSCTLEGCVETGRDLTNGGSRYVFYRRALLGVQWMAVYSTLS